VAVERINKSRCMYCVADCTWEEYCKHTYDCKGAMKQHKATCPFTCIIKDQIVKARSLGSKCVSLLDLKV